MEVLHDLVNDKLNPIDKKQVEQHLKTCEECAGIVEGIQIIKGDYGIKDSKEYIDDFAEKEYQKTKNEIPENFHHLNLVDRDKIASLHKSWLGIAASVVFLVVCGFVWFNFTQKNQNPYFQSHDLAYADASNIVLRGQEEGEEIEKQIKLAKSEFEHKYFQKARLIFEKEFEKYSDFNTGFYLAMSYFGEQNYEQSLTVFQKLLTLEELKKSENKTDLVYFEIFKLYLQKNDLQKAKQLLPKLEKGNHAEKVKKLAVAVHIAD